MTFGSFYVQLKHSSCLVLLTCLCTLFFSWSVWPTCSNSLTLRLLKHSGRQVLQTFLRHGINIYTYCSKAVVIATKPQARRLTIFSPTFWAVFMKRIDACPCKCRHFRNLLQTISSNLRTTKRRPFPEKGANFIAINDLELWRQFPKFSCEIFHS